MGFFSKKNKINTVTPENILNYKRDESIIEKVDIKNFSTLSLEELFKKMNEYNIDSNNIISSDDSNAYIKLIKLKKWDNDARLVIDELYKNKMAFVNLSNLEQIDKTRFKNFIAGVMYIYDGKVEPIDNDAYLFIAKTPR